VIEKRSFILFGRIVIMIVTLVALFPVNAQVFVGLKEGDWVRYEVTYTGSPPESYPTNTRIEVLKIEGTTIITKIENDRLNGTHTSQTTTFDLKDGSAPDLIIIPANLAVGDQVVNKEWNITFPIDGVEEYDFSDVTREMIFANIPIDNVILEYSWDRETGIFIQLDQTTDTFTQKYLAYDTNIVGNVNSDPDSMLIYGIIITVVVITLSLALMIFKRKKKNKCTGIAVRRCTRDTARSVRVSPCHGSFTNVQ
jgi:hypothetical protein